MSSDEFCCAVIVYCLLRCMEFLCAVLSRCSGVPSLCVVCRPTSFAADGILFVALCVVMFSVRVARRRF